MRNNVSNLVKIAKNFGVNPSKGPKNVKIFLSKNNAEFIRERPKFLSFAEFNFAKKVRTRINLFSH